MKIKYLRKKDGFGSVSISDCVGFCLWVKDSSGRWQSFEDCTGDSGCGCGAPPPISSEPQGTVVLVTCSSRKDYFNVGVGHVAYVKFPRYTSRLHQVVCTSFGGEERVFFQGNCGGNGGKNCKAKVRSFPIISTIRLYETPVSPNGKKILLGEGGLVWNMFRD